MFASSSDVSEPLAVLHNEVINSLHLQTVCLDLVSFFSLVWITYSWLCVFFLKKSTFWEVVLTSAGACKKLKMFVFYQSKYPQNDEVFKVLTPITF